jgi:hypothetical protein
MTHWCSAFGHRARSRAQRRRAAAVGRRRPQRRSAGSGRRCAVVATALPESEFADLNLDGFGSALHPAVLQRLAGRHGHIGVIDVTLAAKGLGGGTHSP